MAIVTAVIVPGEVSQAQWDAKYGTTTQALKDMGGADSKFSDDLPEGAINKYDTGVPAATTDELTEGAVNKYDTGVPPATQDELPDGVNAKQFLATEKTKLTGVEAGAEVNPSDLDGVPDSATRKAMSDTEKTKLAGVEESAKDDQTGAEMRDLIAALGDTERKIVVTDPASGECKIISIERNADGNLAYKHDETPEP